ncbi:MAG: HEAT repeat domain-containing protein, partial [bacterium]|nr:HEAT repeat domain-containing protein [bacterium]
MEKNELSVEELTKFENQLQEAIKNPSDFFGDIQRKFDKNTLSSLLGYFLSNAADSNLLKETIKAINSLRDEKNIEDLIDFLMSKGFEDKDSNEIINLKTLCIKAISNYKDKRCIPVLLYCLNDKTANYKMRFQAAEALGKIGDKNAVESLINVVSDEEE